MVPVGYQSPRSEIEQWGGDENIDSQLYVHTTQSQMSHSRLASVDHLGFPAGVSRGGFEREVKTSG